MKKALYTIAIVVLLIAFGFSAFQVGSYFLESKKQGDFDIATRVAVQLQLTDPAARSRDRIVKKSEKNGLYAALDVGCVWLERALAGK